jgi:hypothetical protein
MIALPLRFRLPGAQKYYPQITQRGQRAAEIVSA